MKILHTLLLVLLTSRLLMPPGMCLCKLSAPAARLLAHLLHTRMPPIEPDNDDHADGCPASPLAEALGIKPVSPACPLLPAWVLLTSADAALPGIASWPSTIEPLSRSPDKALYLTLRTLRI